MSANLLYWECVKTCGRGMVMDIYHQTCIYFTDSFIVYNKYTSIFIIELFNYMTPQQRMKQKEYLDKTYPINGEQNAEKSD
jgi:hypothetical protein